MNTDSKTSRFTSGSWHRALTARTTATFLVLVLLVAAEGSTGGEEWNFTVDAAAFAANTYVGSDEYFVTPLPAFRASRDAGNMTWFVSLPLEGFGVSHRNPASGLIRSLAINFGGYRNPEEYSAVGFPCEHSERIRTLLAGSPEATTPLFLQAKVEYPALFGLLGASLGYHPTSVKYGRAEVADKTHHGFLLSLEHQAFVPLTRQFAVGSILGLELMDSNYAEAWYSVSQATKKLSEFDADAGVRDVQATLFASYQVGTKTNLALFYRNTLLLGDAADCPYTVEERQQDFLLRTSYSF